MTWRRVGTRLATRLSTRLSTRLGTRLTALLALLALVVACTADQEACACGGDPASTPVTAGDGVEGTGPFAVVHGDREVFVVDTDSEVVASFTLPEHTEVSQPVPGTVTFLGEDTAWNLDLASGDVETVTGLPASPRSGLADGQRLVLDTHSETDGDAVASDEPGPEHVDGLLDVLTGERRAVEDLVGGPAVVADRVGDAVVLEVEGGAGLVLLRLDQPIADAVEVPAEDRDEVHFSADGHTVAVESEEGIALGDSAEALDEGPVADPGVRVLGVVGEDVLVAHDGALARIAADGARTELAVDADADVDADRLTLADSSGLVAEGDTEDATSWFRVTGTTLRPLPGLRGMTLLAADESGWWFSTGEATAPFRRTPLVAVDPRDGRVHPVRGSLGQLSGLAQAPGSGDGRFRAATFGNDNGFDDLALADARTGRVTVLDVPYATDGSPALPLTITPDGRFLASTTVQGPTITTLRGETSRIVPVFDIDAEPEDGWDHHWVVGR